MKRFLALLLCLAALLSLAACAAQPQETTAPSQPAETQPTEPVDDYDYPEIKDKLTWEKINSFPIKTSDMTVEEMRELCVDFFRFTKSALWTPNADKKYVRNNKGTVDEILKGNIYGSLPYIGMGSGSIYRMMDYLNEETGVLDITRAAQSPTLFGNQCSIGAYWAWGRVMNSATYNWTQGMIVSNGFLRVGPYTYDDKRDNFNEYDNTVVVCEKNGEQVMYQSYALMQPADGFVQYTTAGHVMMCASTAHVEYIDGTDQIDGEKSYLYIIDQHQKWVEGENAEGDKFLYKNYLDRKMTFKKLFEGSYLPFTFAEFLGTDPVEKTEVSLIQSKTTLISGTISEEDRSFQAATTPNKLTWSQFMASKVNSNYGVVDVNLIINDNLGNELYKHAVRTATAGDLSLDMEETGAMVTTWETKELTSGKTYNAEIVVQLATGERPTIFSGKLTYDK